MEHNNSDTPQEHNGSAPAEPGQEAFELAPTNALPVVPEAANGIAEGTHEPELDIFQAFEAGLDGTQNTTFKALIGAMRAEQEIRDEFPQVQDTTGAPAQQVSQEAGPFTGGDLDGSPEDTASNTSITDRLELIAAAEAAAQAAVEYPFPEFLKGPIGALFDPSKSPLTIIGQDDGTASVSMYQPGTVQSRIITASLGPEGEVTMHHVSFPGEGADTSWLSTQVPTHTSRIIGPHGFFMNGMHVPSESGANTSDSFLQKDTLQQLELLCSADRADRPTYDLFSGDPTYQGHFPNTGEYTPMPSPDKVQQMLLLIAGNHAA